MYNFVVWWENMGLKNISLQTLVLPGNVKNIMDYQDFKQGNVKTKMGCK